MTVTTTAKPREFIMVEAHLTTARRAGRTALGRGGLQLGSGLRSLQLLLPAGRYPGRGGCASRKPNGPNAHGLATIDLLAARIAPGRAGPGGRVHPSVQFTGRDCERVLFLGREQH